MIIKFDHISYIASRAEKNSLLRGINQVPVFYEEGLRNLDIKKQLMRKPQIDHDLYFYDLGYPTEYIFYDDLINEPNELEKTVFQGNTLHCLYSDIDKATSFLISILGEAKINVMTDQNIIMCDMKGILDKKPYPLILRESQNNIDTYLDSPGYGVVTLITSTHYNKVPQWGMNTGYETLRINDKRLDICFLKSDYVSLIFEMVYVHKESEDK